MAEGGPFLGATASLSREYAPTGNAAGRLAPSHQHFQPPRLLSHPSQPDQRVTQALQTLSWTPELPM